MKNFEDTTPKINPGDIVLPYNRRLWLVTRLAVLERDNYHCQKCGKKHKHLNVHHKDQTGERIYYSLPNNSMENLISLCPSCHGKSHTKFIFEN